MYWALTVCLKFCCGPRRHWCLRLTSCPSSQSPWCELMDMMPDLLRKGHPFPSLSLYNSQKWPNADLQMWRGQRETPEYTTWRIFFHIQPGKTACIPGKNQLKPPLYILPENEQCLGDSFSACARSSTLCWIKKEVLRLVFSFSGKAQPFERSCPRFHHGFITCGTCHDVLHGMSIRKCSLDKSGAWETPSPLAVFLFHLHRVWLCGQAFPCRFFHFFRCLQGHQMRSLPLWLVMHTLGCWQNAVVILDMWPCLHFAHVAGSPLAFHRLPSYCAAERGYCRCSSKRNTYTGCLLHRMGVRHPGFSNSAYGAV